MRWSMVLDVVVVAAAVAVAVKRRRPGQESFAFG
jgi:hypothetical protein